jgi:hypothetical protein
MNMQTNIDDIRDRIMRLEDAPTFDQLAWDMVLSDLRAAGRLSALNDAERRMDTARHNQPMHVSTDLGMGNEKIKLTLFHVSAETADLVRDGFEWCGKDHSTMEEYDCPFCANDGHETDGTLDCEMCNMTRCCEEICCEYHAWESTCDDFHTSQHIEPAMPEAQHANL